MSNESVNTVYSSVFGGSKDRRMDGIIKSVPRILHIEIRGGLGGIETFLLSVYKNIDRSKLQFDFVSSKEDVAIEKYITEMGGRVFKIRYGNVLDYYHKLVKLIKKNKYTVVHIHKNSAANIIPFLACKRTGVKTIIAHSHNTASPTSKKTIKILHYFNRPILNFLSNEKFACSDLAALWLFGKRNVDKNKIVYIKNGIEIENFVFRDITRKKIRMYLGLNESTLLVGNVGRMSRQKNQVFLVDIFYEVKKVYADTKLLICGDGALKNEILQRAKELGVGDSLIIPGVCNNVNEMLQAMDVYVMPSLYEGLTVAAVEAQCAGLPTIISDAMSRETMIIKQCQIVPLCASAAEWAIKVIEYKGVKREDTRDKIQDAGYDIKMTARYLQNFYIHKCVKNFQKDRTNIKFW